MLSFSGGGSSIEYGYVGESTETETEVTSITETAERITHGYEAAINANGMEVANSYTLAGLPREHNRVSVTVRSTVFSVEDETAIMFHLEDSNLGDCEKSRVRGLDWSRVGKQR